MARCLAAAINHAPGLSGTPDCGHCSNAATKASCARSSAMPTSRTIRVSAAISLGDSIRQTASIARCMWVALTATHHIIFIPLLQGRARGARLFLVGAVLHHHHLANFRLALPSRPVFLVQLHEMP